MWVLVYNVNNMAQKPISYISVNIIYEKEIKEMYIPLGVNIIHESIDQDYYVYQWNSQLIIIFSTENVDLILIIVF